MAAPDYFAPVAARVNLPLLQSKRVVVVGIGSVGSRIANELAKAGVGQFTFVDGDTYEERNRARHSLPQSYVGANKADGMVRYLKDEVPLVKPWASPYYVVESMPDAYLDRLITSADLVIAATDDRGAQRRVGRRALALSVPAIFPGLYREGGGEVVVQLDPRHPCFSCWDGFRTNTEQMRGVVALGADALPIIALSVDLSLGILDPHSEHREMMQDASGARLNQIFVQSAERRLKAPLTRRPGCPSCGTVADISPSFVRDGRRSHKQHRMRKSAPSTQPDGPDYGQRAIHQAAFTNSSHPAAYRSSNADPAELAGSGFCVLLWWFVFTEGFNGFQTWWNPIAWIAVIGWFVYALNS
jgi:molybdopterin/thiamine biosynthesis adenylyltransferase